MFRKASNLIKVTGLGDGQLKPKPYWIKAHILFCPPPCLCILVGKLILRVTYSEIVNTTVLTVHYSFWLMGKYKGINVAFICNGYYFAHCLLFLKLPDLYTEGCVCVCVHLFTHTHPIDQYCIYYQWRVYTSTSIYNICFYILYIKLKAQSLCGREQFYRRKRFWKEESKPELDWGPTMCPCCARYFLNISFISHGWQIGWLTVVE